MQFWPDAAFWRLWGCAAALSTLFNTAFLHLPASAESLKASFYGAESGRRTASGAAFNAMGFTAAHRSWAFGTKLRVCLARCAVVVVNDRGPAVRTGRSIDLSRGAARAIGLETRGVAIITVNRLN